MFSFFNLTSRRNDYFEHIFLSQHELEVAELQNQKSNTEAQKKIDEAKSTISQIETEKQRLQVL